MHAEPDRTRRHTGAAAQQRIDAVGTGTLVQCADAGGAAIGARIAALEREWDIDRVVEAEAAAAGLVALAFAARRRAPARLLLPAFVAGALLVQALTGRYPLLPLFRRLGLRSAREIARERYALKALRGDFARGGPAPQQPAVTLHEARRARLPPTSQRVARSTDARVNHAIRARTEAELLRLDGAGRAQLDARIAALAREWDIERVLQLNASLVASLGLALGALRDRRFLLLPAAVFAFLGQHAVQGWCPPVPLFRRLGVRTVGEIERERHAAKALRGDYAGVPAAGAAPLTERVRAVLAAVDA